MHIFQYTNEFLKNSFCQIYHDELHIILMNVGPI